MPCYERRTISQVAWEKANVELLGKALEELGFTQYRTLQAGVHNWSDGLNSITYDGKTLAKNAYGQLSEEEQQRWENKVRQGYAKQAVNLAANRYGWSMSERTPGQLVAQKR